MRDYGIVWVDEWKSTVRKKMAAVHFTTIPCEPNTTNRHKNAIYFFAKFLPILIIILYARFEVFRTFLCVFMSLFLGGVSYAKNYG